MANVKDIRIDEQFNLQISAGDFVVSESDQDHINIILNSFVGSYKEFPLVGFGLIAYQSSPVNQQVLARGITIQLNADGYQVNKVTVQPDYEIFIDAERVK